MLPGAAARGRLAGGDLQRLRLLLVVLGELGRHARPTSSDARAVRARPREPASSRSPATTATCCSGSSSAACRCSGSSRPRTSPAAAVERGIPTLVAFFGGATATRAARRGPRGRPRASATTSSRTCPTSTTSSRASAILLKPDGSRDDGVPAPAAADLEHASSTRSTTSTSPTSRCSRCAPVFERARPARLRRRGAADARRLAAGLRCARRAGRGGATASWRCSRAGARGRAATASSAIAAFDQQVRAVKRDLLELLIGFRRDGSADRGLRRGGQGQHAAQLLRHPRRPDRVRRRPQPAQAGPLPAGHAAADPRAGADRRDQARLRPDPALEPAQTRSSSRWRTCATGAAASSSRCPGRRCSSEPRPQLAALGRRGRRGDARPRDRALPVLPQPHRRRRAPDLRRDRAHGAARATRGAERHAGLRLDRCRASGTSATRCLTAPDGRVESSTSPTPTSTSSTTASRFRAALSLERAARAPLHRPGAARRDPVPHLLLRRELGLLPPPPSASSSCRRRLRGRASTRRSRTAAHLRGGASSPGESDGRGPALDLRLPSLALQRQPLGVVLAATLARHLAASGCDARYRFLFIPGDDRADRPGSRATSSGCAGSGTAWSSRASATPARSRTSAAAAGTARSTAPPPRAGRRRRPDRATSPRSATTSGSSARRASICPSASSRARRPTVSRSTTPRPTTSSFVRPQALGDSFGATST